MVMLRELIFNLHSNTEKLLMCVIKDEYENYIRSMYMCSVIYVLAFKSSVSCLSFSSSLDCLNIAKHSRRGAFSSVAKQQAQPNYPAKEYTAKQLMRIQRTRRELLDGATDKNQCS